MRAAAGVADGEEEGRRTTGRGRGGRRRTAGRRRVHGRGGVRTSGVRALCTSVKDLGVGKQRFAPRPVHTGPMLAVAQGSCTAARVRRIAVAQGCCPATRVNYPWRRSVPCATAKEFFLYFVSAFNFLFAFLFSFCAFHLRHPNFSLHLMFHCILISIYDYKFKSHFKY